MNNPLISPNLGVFVWMLVAFGLLAFILITIGWPMVLKALNTREKAIADSLNAAEQAREEMRQLQAHNEDLLKEAKLQRDEILRNARQTSDKIAEDTRLKAQAEADRILEAARENINYEKLKAMHDLKNQIANLSIEIAEKLIMAELSDKEAANTLIDRELEKAEL